MEFRRRILSAVCFCCCCRSPDSDISDACEVYSGESINNKQIVDRVDNATTHSTKQNNNIRHSTAGGSNSLTEHVKLIKIRADLDTCSTDLSQASRESTKNTAKKTSSVDVDESKSSSVQPTVRRARKLSQTLNEVEFVAKRLRETSSLEFVYSSPKNSRTETESNTPTNPLIHSTRNHLEFDQRYHGEHHHGDISSNHSDHDISGDMEIIKSTQKESFVSVNNNESSKLLPRKSQLRLASSLSMPNYIYLNSTYESQYFNTEENSILNLGAGNTAAENNGRWSALSWNTPQSRCQSSIAEFNEEIEGPILCKGMGDIDMEILLSSDDSVDDFKTTIEKYKSETYLVPSRTTAVSAGVEKGKGLVAAGEPAAFTAKSTSSDLSVAESKSLYEKKEKTSSKDVVKSNSSSDSSQLPSKKSLTLTSPRSSSGLKLSLESSSVLGADNANVNVWHPIILEEDEDEEHH